MWPFKPNPVQLVTVASALPQASASSPHPNLTAGVEPSVRNFWDWTPEHIRQAEFSANWGATRYAANLCEMLLGDDRIGPLLQGRAESLLGLTPTFEKSGDKRRSGRAVRALEVEEDWWSAYDDADLAQMVVWGILLGFSVAKHEWPTDPETGRVLPCPRFWHPQHLRNDLVTRKWMISVASDGDGGQGVEQELVPGNGTWVFHTPYGSNRPWIYGLWRGLSRIALLKAYAMADWARASEKGALLVGTAQLPSVNSGAGGQQSTVAQRQQLAEDIFRRGKAAVAFLPPGFDLKLVQVQANTEKLYNAQIDMANEAIAIAIRGGNLTTNVTTGSLAATEAQERLGDDSKRRFDAQKLTQTIHKQSLTYWAEYNFGDPRLAPWPVYPVEEREDLQLKANTMDLAAGALQTFQSMGFVVDHKAFAEEFELDEFLSAPDPNAPAPVTVPTLDDAKKVAAEPTPASPAPPPGTPPPASPPTHTK